MLLPRRFWKSSHEQIVHSDEEEEEEEEEKTEVGTAALKPKDVWNERFDSSVQAESARAALESYLIPMCKVIIAEASSRAALNSLKRKHCCPEAELDELPIAYEEVWDM